MKSINYCEDAPVIVQVGCETVHFTHVHCHTRHKESGLSIIFCRRHQQNWRRLFLLFLAVALAQDVHEKVMILSAVYAELHPERSQETQERLTDRLACNNSFLFILHVASPTANICWWHECMFHSDYSIPLQIHVC